MDSFTAIGGRFIIGRDRLSFQTGGAIAQAHGKAHDIPGMPACIVSFDEPLKVSELDQTVAERKATQGGFDTKRWYEGIAWKHAYLLTLSTGQRFVYVWCIVDCWRSFLFLDQESAGKHVQHQEQDDKLSP
jgi:hypothetical protein